MTDVIVVCEGQTEEIFVKRFLGPSLTGRSVFVTPQLIATSRHSKGGALSGQRVLGFLRKTLRQRSDTYVTTFFDLYGLRPDFPGLAGAAQCSDPLDRAEKIEAAFGAAVVQVVECRPSRFFPHIQPYEFEALLFTQVSAFAKAEPEWQPFAGELDGARQASDSPEHINDGQNTHPSARLRCLTPRYNKVRHGVAVFDEIGIERIRAECRHFDQWVTRLEELPPLRGAE